MKIKLKSGGIIKLQKGKIVKALVETTTKPSGIFANVSSKTGASKALLDVNKAVGVTQKRPRIMVQHIPEKQYVRTVPLSTLNIESKAAEAAQRAIEDRAYEVKQNQIDLARKLQRLWDEQGINTVAADRKAMMKAIQINPKTSTPAPEGQFKLPYRSWYSDGQPIMFEGETVKDWMDAAGDYFKIGPRSAVLQAEKPLKTASNYFDIIGEIPRKGGPVAPKTVMDAFNEGLRNLKELYFTGYNTEKENKSLNILGWVGSEKAKQLLKSNYIDYNELDQIANDAEKYWTSFNPYTKQLFKDFYKYVRERPDRYQYIDASKMRQRGYKQSINALKGWIEKAKLENNISKSIND